MRLTLIIGSTNFSAEANMLGYTYELIDRLGPNGGIMEDGTETIDLLARKLKVTWPLNALTTARMAQLHTECAAADVTATTFDPRTNADAQHVFHPNISQGGCVWRGDGATKYITGPVLTLLEK